MNYIYQLNEFYLTLDYKSLPANAIAVYFVLLQIANKTGWLDRFDVANSVLMSKCNLDKQAMEGARNSLVNKGYITYTKGKNKTVAPTYSIIQLYQEKEYTQEDTVKDTLKHTQQYTQQHTLEDTQEHTNNKQNKTKQNNKSKEERKSEDTIPSFNKMIEEYTNNIQLQNELKNHLKTRKAKKATLTNRAIELSLQTLDKLANNDSEKIAIVKKSIERGWTGFFKLDKEDLVKLPKIEEKIDYASIPWGEEHPLYDPAYEDGGYEKAIQIMGGVVNE